MFINSIVTAFPTPNITPTESEPFEQAEQNCPDAPRSPKSTELPGMVKLISSIVSVADVRAPANTPLS